MSVTHTDSEVDAQLNKTSKALDTGESQWPGLTYEQGVDAALRWVMGWSDEAPMDDE